MNAAYNLATFDDPTQNIVFPIPACWVNLPNDDQKWLRQHYADQKAITSAGLSRPLSVTELVHYIENDATLSSAKRLADRLRFLIEASEEEYPDQAPIRSESLIDFVKLLEFFPMFFYPDVVLSYSGNIRAEWHDTKRGVFVGLEFFGEDNVKCVLFLPNRRQHNKREMYGVTTTIDLLSNLFRQVNAYSWLVSTEDSAK